MDFNIDATTDCFAEMNYTGSMYVPHYAGYIANDTLEKTESFIVINVNVSKKFQLLANNSITISAAVNNLFDSYQEDLDKGPYRDAGYIYGPRFPRVFRIGVKYDF